jgi:hypothetical protein
MAEPRPRVAQWNRPGPRSPSSDAASQLLMMPGAAPLAAAVVVTVLVNDKNACRCYTPTANQY